MKNPAFSILGLALLIGSSLAYAGTPNSNTVVNNGMSSWTVNGQTNPSLTLVRGQTYTFAMQSVSSVHPFNINTINTTGSANQYNNGVTNNGATGTQTLTFVVPANAPDVLHYNCGNHAAMNGSIAVVDAGDPPISMNVVNVGMTAWSIDGLSNPALTLTRGKTYEFVMQNTSAVHPFNINAFNTTGSANQYNNGVTNNGASGTQTLTFVVPNDAPDGLHYNCGNHAAMNGPISIVNEVLFADGFDPIPVVAPK
ncbi:MAG: hypothetical protein ABIR16_07210 [Dokdonella sp.]